jgi:hypothetical protein
MPNHTRVPDATTRVVNEHHLLESVALALAAHDDISDATTTDVLATVGDALGNNSEHLVLREDLCAACRSTVEAIER